MSELRRLGEIISPTLSKLETSDGARAYGLWARAAGEPIAANARPRRFARGLLTVECSSSIWANELTYLTPQLLARMAELEPGGPVERLRFVTSHTPFGPQRGSVGGPAAQGRGAAGSGPDAAARRPEKARSGPDAARWPEKAGSPAFAGQVDRPSTAKTDGRERRRRDADPAAARRAAEAVGDERLRVAILAALDRRPDAPEAAPGDGPSVNQK